MNSADQLAFDLIRRDQTRVRQLVEELDHRVDLLADRLENAQPTPPPAPLRPRESARRPSWYEEPRTQEQEYSPLPPPALPTASHSSLAHDSEPNANSNDSTTPLQTTPSEPLELRVGTFWLARIGIVILLTGLVFLGNYAYHRIVPLLGAWGKLSLLTIAGIALSGTGAWLERSREEMRNYGRVLFAGGAATIYYTAYAAHFIAALRVIQSPVIGGGLLLALTGVFIWHADQRRSEAVAVPAVLLAYYTSAINSIGGFTLFSNLLLTAAAVFFLIRHRWTRLTHISLVATYGSYAFWRFSHAVLAGGASSGFGVGIGFVAAYWILFTAAVFLPAPKVMHTAERAAFLSLNNAAFFTFSAIHFGAHQPDAFWIFALAYGVVLLGLATFAARFRAEERALDGAYLAQGLALVTLGFAAKLSGPQLAIVLAVESVSLLSASRRRHGWLYELAAGLCACEATWLALVQIGTHSVQPLALGLPVAALLSSAAWWVKRLRGETGRFSERALGFSALGLAVVIGIIWNAAPATWVPAWFAAVACLSVVAILAGLPEVGWPAQAFLLIGFADFLSRSAIAAPNPWWNPLPLVAAALFLMHWWQRQKTIALPDETRTVPEAACALIAVATGVFWLRAFQHGNAWLAGTSLVAFGTLTYGLIAGAPALAVCSQIFSVLSVFAFTTGIMFDEPSRAAALAPIANLALTSILIGRHRGARSATRPLISQAYRIGALAMLAGWSLKFVDEAWWTAFFAGVGVLFILFGASTRNSERTACGAAYAGVGLILVWYRLGSPVTFPDLAAILAIPASLRIARHASAKTAMVPQGRSALVIGAVATLWLWLTRWVLTHGPAGHLTTAWAILALAILAAGLGLRERIYRLGGFAILGLTLVRLFAFDVWRFDTLPRIVSFLVLGAVLLSLSFVYNRFADAIRRWL